MSGAAEQGAGDAGTKTTTSQGQQTAAGATTAGAGGAAGAGSAQTAGTTAGASTQAQGAGDEHTRMSRDAFNERLREAEQAAINKALKKLGVASLDDAEKAIGKAKQLEQEKMTETDRLKARLGELEPVAGRVKSMQDALEKHATARLKAQPDAVRKHVKAVAGDDPEKILAELDSMAEHGLLEALTKNANAGTAAAGADGKAGDGKTTAAQGDTRPPANTRAGAGSPPPATPPGQQKHPRDMTPEEFAKFQREHLNTLPK